MGRQRLGPGCADPWHHHLVLGTWNVTLLAGKELELVWEMHRYKLDMVGLTSMHSTGLEANSWRGAGLSPFPVLPRVWGARKGFHPGTP